MAAESARPAAKEAAKSATPESKFVYKTIGERQLTVEMDYPPDWKKGDKRPAIVFFFGGAWTHGSPSAFAPQGAYFAKRGLVCARPDYRTKSKEDVTIAQCVEDAFSAMRWVRKNAEMLGVDPTRIVASGGSAGGHLAACLFFTEDLPAGDDDVSVSPKPAAMILYNPALDPAGFESGNLTKGMDKETLVKISPARLLRKDMPPTLMVDGTEDMFNPSITEFVDKEKELGAHVETMYVEGQPHGFFNYSPWLEKTTERADKFLQSIGYLGKEPKVELPTKAKPPEQAAKAPGAARKAGPRPKAPASRASAPAAVEE
ncbi:MAG: alpha/beta hydrolase [Candidatus Sumerlaeota bacterium]|nr:alpha/beta hydrolase [Candidatus Sumerlaeota bacterium]